jgi:hypothetical protein
MPGTSSVSQGQKKIVSQDWHDTGEADHLQTMPEKNKQS